jgi:hypothetical protein
MKKCIQRLSILNMSQSYRQPNPLSMVRQLIMLRYKDENYIYLLLYYFLLYYELFQQF